MVREYVLTAFEQAIVSRVIRFLTRAEANRHADADEEERFCQYVLDWCTSEQRKTICATLHRVCERLERQS